MPVPTAASNCGHAVRGGRRVVLKPTKRCKRRSVPSVRQFGTEGTERTKHGIAPSIAVEWRSSVFGHLAGNEGREEANSRVYFVTSTPGYARTATSCYKTANMIGSVHPQNGSSAAVLRT